MAGAADQLELFAAPQPAPSTPTATVIPFPGRRMVGRIRRQGRMLRGWGDLAALRHLDRVHAATVDRLVGLGIEPAAAEREATALAEGIAAARDGVLPEAERQV